MRDKYIHIYTPCMYTEWRVHTQNERTTKMKTENSTVCKREDDNLAGRNAIQLTVSNDRCWLKRDGVPKECAHTYTLCVCIVIHFHFILFAVICLWYRLVWGLCVCMRLEM